MATVTAALPAAFDTRIRPADAETARWLSEATLRLRREIAWLWHQRADAAGGADDRVPPPGDALAESLDIARYAEQKRRFFESDAAARYLDASIAGLRKQATSHDGPWAAIRHRLQLDDTAQLVLALALLAKADAASGAVFASCHSDNARPLPSLALAQRLADEPTDVLAIDAAHPLFRHGLLTFCGDAGSGWAQCFEMPALIARACLFDDGRLPPDLQPLSSPQPPRVPAELVAAARAHAGTPERSAFVPLLGDVGTDFPSWGAFLAGCNDRLVLTMRGNAMPEPARLAALATWCWLHDADLLLPLVLAPADEHARPSPWPSAPIRWLAPITDQRATRALPAELLQPALQLPPTDHALRVDRLTRALGASAPALAEDIADVARRFRFGAPAIDAIARAACAHPPLTAQDLHALCRAQSRPDLGHLAQAVRPRFALAEMVLPAAQREQLAEIVRATRALSRVHYGFGTARAWNESGLSALFCGPPGTGKTMAAEAIAHELSLPMYRIDLSQVVNKYIGETEKNLKRVFDAIETSDCVVFFDEADALFGKRTSVKDAHDRFANIEISYLLERMERLNGVAILATNRRRDLDEAFLRRLRYLVDFPLPGENERRHLWRYVFPDVVDVAALDFDFLARTFQLAGGHIRSIALNACLQSAASDPPRVEMTAVLAAVKRELDKLGRPISAESFGSHHALVRHLFDEAAS